MNEPSILYYLKSKLGMTNGEKIEIPDEELDAPAVLYEAEEEQAVESQLSTLKSLISKPANLSVGNFPWRSLLALLLALIGQFALEPPRRSTETGLVFYFAAFSMLALAYLREEWRLPASREDISNPG